MGTLATAEVKRGETFKVEVRRVIRASRQRVFEAWTRPDELRKWLAPGPMSMVKADTDLQIGGKYRLQMKGSMDGLPENAERRIAVEGEYTAVVPNELISFTWRPDWNPEDESTVTVRLRDVEGGTEMLFTHERINTEAASQGYTRGWASCFDKLDQSL